MKNLNRVASILTLPTIIIEIILNKSIYGDLSKYEYLLRYLSFKMAKIDNFANLNQFCERT